MKHFLVFFLTIGVLQLSAQEPKANSFHGKVKSVEEHSFRAKSRHGEIVKGGPSHEFNWQYDYIMKYDSLGLPQERTWLNAKGKPTRVTSYVYDNKRMLLEENTVDGKGKAETSFKYANEYNAQGFIIKRILTASTLPKTATFIYSRDAKGNIYESRVIDEGTPAQMIDSRRFDSAWHCTRQWVYTTGWKVQSYYDLAYDEKGRLSEQTMYSPDNKVLLLYRWKYDENNHLIRHEICSANSSSCEAWTYKDEYDKMGNSIRRIEYRNGKPVYVVERTFTYY